TYDEQGRVKTLKTWQDFAGNSGMAVTTWSYNPQRGWLDNKRYADDQGPTYTYWPSGRLKTRVWARTPTITTTYTYNHAGDLASTDYDDTTPDVTLTYDRLGRLHSKADGTGECTYAYEGLTALIATETHSTGLLAGQSLTRTYDSSLLLRGLSGASVPSVTYDYDAASRLDTVTVSRRSELTQFQAFRFDPPRVKERA
ncbi:MAG TPA: hypothetical protein VJU18_19230, partial [Vicinamibacteria bacterium]|nr:hypothetical protein [Vicinamibacteria bacterium]